VPGERIVAVTAGGRGYGRPGEHVRDDVLEGLVSEERARDVYTLASDAPRVYAAGPQRFASPSRDEVLLDSPTRRTRRPAEARV
jgi:N-methylhydantoinase B/oxoprolinase/acetone carboxylase alpha subunit